MTNPETACRTSQHCAHHGWCHRCDPEFAAVMSRVNVAIQRTDADETHWGPLYAAVAEALRPAAVSVPPPAPQAADRAAGWLDAAAECNKAGGAYAGRGANDSASAAFALMETFLRKAGEAEYVATPCDPMVACEDGGEPCHTHERLMGHAEGEHELCAPDCGEPWVRRLAAEAPTTTKPETATEAPADRGTLRRKFGDVLRHWGLLDEQIDQKAAEEYAVTDLLALLPEQTSRAAETEHLRDRLTSCRERVGIAADKAIAAEETIERARQARRRLTSALIAVEPLLTTPYPDDPRWSPWTRFVGPALKELSDALRTGPAANVEPAAGVRQDGAQSQEEPRG